MEKSRFFSRGRCYRWTILYTIDSAVGLGVGVGFGGGGEGPKVVCFWVLENEMIMIACRFCFGGEKDDETTPAGSSFRPMWGDWKRIRFLIDPDR